MQYYKISIVMTGKGYSKNNEYRIFDDEQTTFETLEKVQDFLNKRYGSCKKVKMYGENRNTGESRHIGYVYCFNNTDLSHYPVQKWHQQDWVSVTRIDEQVVIVN